MNTKIATSGIWFIALSLVYRSNLRKTCRSPKRSWNIVSCLICLSRAHTQTATDASRQATLGQGEYSSSSSTGCVGGQCRLSGSPKPTSSAVFRVKEIGDREDRAGVAGAAMWNTTDFYGVTIKSIICCRGWTNSKWVMMTVIRCNDSTGLIIFTWNTCWNA